MTHARSVAVAVRAAALIVILQALIPPAAMACTTASCSLASRPGDGSLRRGQVQVEVAYRYVDQGRPLLGSRSLRGTEAGEPAVVRPLVDFEAGRLIPGGHLEWRATGSSLQVDVGYGLTSRLSLLASVPLGRRSLDHHSLDPASTGHQGHGGSAASPRRSSIAGMGDIQLTGRLRLGAAWTLGTAVKLSNGSHTRRDEFGRIADPMQQPGTGRAALLAMVQRRTTTLPLGLSGAVAASYQRSFTNDLGYRMGDEATLTLRGSRPLPRRLAATAQVKAWRAERNRYRGQASLSTGGIAVYVVPGLSWTTPFGVGLYGSAQIPIYEKVNELQLGTGLVALLGVSRSFR